MIDDSFLLIIEDDPFVREALEDLLDAFGMQVAAADSGEQGVAFFQNRHREVDAVILDLGLRGMGGQDTLRALRQIDPSVKVILSSGYDQHEVFSQLQKQKVDGFLPKPYNADSLMKQLRAVLNGH